MPLELHFLPASEGDAIWIRWGDDLQHQLLIDMGRERNGREIRARLVELDKAERHFELLVVTHVDADHIAGVLTGIAEVEPLDGLGFDDVWFNGWAHLHGERMPEPDAGDGLEPMGAAQGERLTSWLNTPWNEAFDRGPVERGDDLPSVTLSDDLTLTVLGPTRERLVNLQDTWETEVHIAIEKGGLTEVSEGLEPLGEHPVEPELTSFADLEALADAQTRPPDSKEANGSSIALLLEWRQRRVLLTGDAYAPDLVEALELLGEPLPVAIDVFKLPHHGSEGNLSDELVAAVSCPQWVFSTNGSRHHHPHAAAVARVLRQRVTPRPQLMFNVASEFNQWWVNDDWMNTFDYTTETGSDEDGLVLTLEPR
jgi:hypothetical protein